MIDRMQLGQVPAKPHTVFKVDEALAYEECFTREGFDGAYSILYHRHPPTGASSYGPSERGWAAAEKAAERVLSRRHFLSSKVESGGQMIDKRTPLLFNDDVTLYVSRPGESDDAYLANGDGDDLHFVLEGQGQLVSQFGILPFQAGDYVFIPRSVIHRFVWSEPGHVLTFESHGGAKVPDNFRNAHGQLRMDAPYSHRDFGRPQWPEEGLDKATEEGPRAVIIKKAGQFSEYQMQENPLDILGWDGSTWPFTFAIEKYQPRTGAIHLPPTAHTTFVGRRMVVCSFVPRVTDFHPDAVPCPYPHSSVDCDEVLFYVRGNFTSRRGVGPGSISFHPAGVVHGPQPGAYEASIGTSRTEEMAVMLDTFLPLHPTTAALEIEDPGYMASWNTKR